YDFRPMLKGTAPAVSGADLAICHMETVYGRNGGPYTPGRRREHVGVHPPDPLGVRGEVGTLEQPDPHHRTAPRP
ncbi:hypothetical protein DLE01_11840, partial [Streptomyces sp. FT05W]